MVAIFQDGRWYVFVHYPNTYDDMLPPHTYIYCPVDSMPLLLIITNDRCMAQSVCTKPSNKSQQYPLWSLQCFVNIATDQNSRADDRQSSWYRAKIKTKGKRYADKSLRMTEKLVLMIHIQMFGENYFIVHVIRPTQCISLIRVIDAMILLWKHRV